MLDPKLYYSLFEINPDGKKVLEEMARLFYDRPSFEPENQYVTAFNEGRKAVLQHIFRQMTKSQQIPMEDTPHDD